MSVIHAAILGLIQGLTEFLPISSSGHLAVVSKLLEYNTPGLLLEASVHIGTMLAIVIYFRKHIARLIVGLVTNGTGNLAASDSYKAGVSRYRSVKILALLALSFLCTGVVAMVIKGWASYAFDMPAFAGVLFVLTALILVSTRFIGTRSSNADLLGIGIKVAILIGLVQGLAVFPGISRSGITIVVALWAGQNNQVSAEYSFLLAIPTIIAASIYSFWNVGAIPVDVSFELVIAAAMALVVGLVSIHWLMRWLRQGRLWWFSGYCAFVGVISIAGYLLGII
jgi:undecaprenyl-diphosphatase